jgi:hypothetical protein
MMAGERLYRLLLRAYPAHFRDSYEREMVLVFRNQRRDGATRALSYWTGLVMDMARSAPREWREELSSNIHSGGVFVKTMAIVAVLVAAFELINTAAEVQGGGFAGRDPLAQAGIVAAVLAMLGLLASGVGLLRRGRAAEPLARIAATGCLTSFAFTGLARPVFSNLAMMAGIGFPLALLAWLFTRRARPTSGTVTS